MERSNILEDQTRSRQLTSKAAAAAQEGTLYQNTMAASESNSRTHRDEQGQQPDPTVNLEPAGQNGSDRGLARSPDISALQEWGNRHLPTTRPCQAIPLPSQVRPDGLRAQFAAEHTPFLRIPYPTGNYGRAYQRPRDRR